MKAFKKCWSFIGTSGAWLAILLIVMVFEASLGQTLKGSFYFFIAFLGYFLSRISEALESKNKDT